MSPDIFTQIHQMRPPSVRFVANRWHPHRVALGGIGVEAKVLLKSLIAPKPSKGRFLILGRARSGTTLLRRLLNNHSQIRCDGEVLYRRVLAPKLLLRNLAQKCPDPVYGAKLLSYQMVLVHRMTDPKSFLRALHEQNVVLVHIERDTFFQTLSLTVAQDRNQYHSDKGARAPTQKQHVDPEKFVHRLQWNAALLDYERAMLADVPHIHVSYERDLSEPKQQGPTINRICDALQVTPEPVESELQKLLSSNPEHVLENYSEIVEKTSAAGYGHFVPRALP